METFYSQISILTVFRGYLGLIQETEVWKILWEEYTKFCDFGYGFSVTRTLKETKCII